MNPAQSGERRMTSAESCPILRLASNVGARRVWPTASSPLDFVTFWSRSGRWKNRITAKAGTTGTTQVQGGDAATRKGAQAGVWPESPCSAATPRRGKARHSIGWDALLFPFPSSSSVSLSPCCSAFSRRLPNLRVNSPACRVTKEENGPDTRAGTVSSMEERRTRRVFAENGKPELGAPEPEARPACDPTAGTARGSPEAGHWRSKAPEDRAAA